MLKRKITALLTALMFLLTGCNGGAARQIIKYDIPARVSNLDPQFATDSAARMIISNSFLGLFRQLTSGEVVPGMATAYEVSDDGLTYTLHLRDDVQWASNKKKSAYHETAVTAHDFVFGLSRMFDSAAFSPFASDLSSIRNAESILKGTAPRSSLGVRALDDFTLEITLARPDHLLPERLAASYAAPCNQAFFESTRARYGLDSGNLLYNGPFYVRSWSDDGILLRQNGSAPPDERATALGVNLYVTPGTDGAPFDPAKRFLSGSTDASRIHYESLPAARDLGGEVAMFQDTVWVLLFNTRTPYFSNPDIRRAVAYAVDREAPGSYLPDNLSPAPMLVPPTVTSSDGAFRDYAGVNNPIEPNPDFARRYLEKGLEEIGANYFGFDELLVCDDSSQPLLTGFVQGSLQKSLSTFAGLTSLPRDKLFDRVRSGDFQAAILPLTISYSSPDALFSYFKTGSSLNWSGYSSSSFDKLLAGTARLDPQAQRAAYKQAEQLLLADAAAVPLYFETTYYATGKGISGIEFSPFLSGVSFRDARRE